MRSLCEAKGGLWLGVAWLVVAGGATGCTGAGRFVTAEAEMAYRPGFPDFDLEVIASLEDDRPGIEVYLGVPYASLVFAAADTGYVAAFEAVVRVWDEGERMVVREATTDTVRAATRAQAGSFRRVHRRLRIPLDPGDYEVEARLADPATGEVATRRRHVTVFGPDPAALVLSDVLLLARWGALPFEPLVAPHTPAGFDSLRARVLLYGPGEEAPGAVALAMRLLRLRADTSVAAPPYALPVMRGALAYQGVRYDEADTLQVTRRRVQPPASGLEVLFSLPPLEPGLYRVEVEARPDTPAAGRNALRRVRDLVVRPPDFPRITTLEAMVAALTYIAYPDEMEALAGAGDPAERRRRFDAFWGRLMPDRRRAADVLARYYGRVEEANLRYTTFKEGWKTDRGMVFILLGPPAYVDRRFDAEVWYYGYGLPDEHTYTFERVRVYGSDGRFVNYVLLRDPSYHQAWIDLVRRWRRGEAL
ncbi:GWxTD domain-containing protein [Rhodocaloribacter litoris]|uniref:GWxTD domain-containing protein n=1 Tax=Rhodocaloribacter litoris TaxID=2558931 RepID=UPI001E5C4CF8|nr:GWxTD domain-containing protein [Rhodocaloribacter litoris]QXD15527.1 GWxTD domain-containing protein [Rhodocaloribacter litoris]